MARATARSRRSKPEVQEEFERVERDVADVKEALVAKDVELARHKDLETRQAVQGLTVESVVLNVSNLNLDISRALSDVSGKLSAEVDRLNRLREAVALETKELERLHKVDIAATALDYLVEEYRAEKEKLEREMAAQRDAWLEERQAQAREQREADEALKKQRQREADDFEYKKAQERKKAQDKHDEDMRLLEKKNLERQESLDKSWNERELNLKSAEEELARYKLEVESFPARLKEERERAAELATASVRQSANQEILLLKRDAESEKRVSDLRIQALEEAAKARTGQLELLSRQLEEAKKQVQDIAVKAIEGASGASALAHINKIAMEQAKTRAGQI